MIYRITHITNYDYTGFASLCHNEIRLIPRQLEHQNVISKRIEISPRPNVLREREDFFGNHLYYFSIQQPHGKLRIKTVSTVRIDPVAPPEDLSGSMPWEQAVKTICEAKDQKELDARQFTFDSPLVAASEQLAEYARLSFEPGRPVTAAFYDLMERIHEDFEFKSGFTTVSTPLSHVLEHRRGVCQDFAQLAIGCARSMGLAARYVSGYIETIPPPGKEKLRGADVSHAWFGGYVPGRGWIDFDPTNNKIPCDQHIVTAWGRDFSDITPVKGIVFSGGGHKLNVSVDVERVEDGLKSMDSGDES